SSVINFQVDVFIYKDFAKAFDRVGHAHEVRLKKLHTYGFSDFLFQLMISNFIDRILKRNGYRNCRARKKPFISKRNRKKRLNFAKLHLKKDQSFWSKVIFSDESKCNTHHNDGPIKIYKKQNQVETVEHGGGAVLVWGCMTAAGVGNLVFIDSIIDKYLYLDILKDNLQKSTVRLGLNGSYIFQQDNEPKHSARLVQEWLLFNVPKQLHSPPQSPDMNLIEHLWNAISRKLKNKHITNKAELKSAILEI
ncbi:hypothetical protein ILUMI_01634, partial [Ignelater luminosus]